MSHVNDGIVNVIGELRSVITSKEKYIDELTKKLQKALTDNAEINSVNANLTNSIASYRNEISSLKCRINNLIEETLKDTVNASGL